MVRMRYAVGLTYEVRDPTADFIFNFHAAQTARQAVTTESLQLTPALPVEPHTEPTLLNRRLRVRAPKGHFSVSYAATVNIDHLLTPPEQLFEVPVADLPLDVITYLAPSRYCESDRLMEFALREFGGYQRGYPLVITIRDWVCRYVRFSPHSTNECTSAVSTLVERKGVCRDYAHLMIALCRALSIPARFSSSLDYGADPLMGPPDFHAFVEVFLGQRWYLVDPSNASVPMGLLRIGTGRDAADVPIAMVFGNVKPSRPLVEVQAIASSALGFSMPIDTAQGISTW
ncbi:transglutaminase family protein [Ralstonia solanacearum]|uniref:Transglutaminase n=1 Tax=Ralstonia solanacearum K60 TaxID=1091042 RepID=A0AAP8D5C1_RALSL|nr:transglutaminase family protein [Ralstonia solanacearum]MBT1538428.1 transglutaminase family protein [Ralstonia solanacearum]OYQ14676.1 transglutaminase [Ralstonia solanacearum K60]QOK82048.1 transglutaminase family protein [Ralstonia solanacearum]RIJ85547.1 transglutaminase family protein [Ralstonia solanacearum]CCF95691.1 conserved hypothethical protein,transglutaminase-like and cysteine proteinases domains [Ralstonia solanacearum K60]